MIQKEFVCLNSESKARHINLDLPLTAAVRGELDA
jgi:hypothetical protein